ncbi:hypothetical protein BGZ70_006590 [Mortierella alpina]|uniref:Cyclin N-terminal domain-containing protein n=1 Tax=Mortierella alpina TaxID=64518 RepID=A0A9P6M3V2_MORAP|nr:hypothetical protein BGZ70_006590 [Mortierella alpina]
MDSTLDASTFNIAHISSSSSLSTPALLGTGMVTKVPNEPPMGALQMRSPPESITSPSPTSSDTVTNGSTSTVGSQVATPQQQYLPSMLRGKNSAILAFGISSGLTATSRGCYTPPPSYRAIPEIFDDERYRQQSMSESTISMSTREEIPKRRAAESPSARPRPRSQTMAQRQRPRSMSAAKPPLLPGRHRAPLHTRDIIGEATDVEETSQLNENSSQEERFSQRDEFWFPGSDDPPAFDSNKRSRVDLRGAAGRQFRTVTMSEGVRPPMLRKSSTNITGFGDMKLGDGSLTDSSNLPSHPEGSTEDVLSESDDTVMETDSENAVDSENALDSENTLVPQTPRKPRPRRTPLSEIMTPSRIATEAVSSNFAREPLPIDVSISSQPLEPVAMREPLGPLMTRQPRKALARPRLHIVNPFPMNHTYWEEYAQDTLNYLHEIEGRYDRYMYMTPPSDFAFNRSVLVQWLMELCYGYFRFQPVTLHAAVNLLDRYITARTLEKVPLDKLQCVGMCALMIAGKLEENTIRLSTQDLCGLCDLYSTKEIASTELTMLVTLKFEVLVASATAFSDYFKRAIPDHPDVMLLIDFLCDFSLISHEFLDFNTSQIAASAMWIAMCAYGQDWNEDLAILTGYTRKDLTPCSVLFKRLVCMQTDTLELRLTLGPRYPLEQTLATLTRTLS